MHEKSVLLPLMPVLLVSPQQPLPAAWLPAVATFSMYPLLAKDGLELAYAACLLLWAGLCLCSPSELVEAAAAAADGVGSKESSSRGRGPDAPYTRQKGVRKGVRRTGSRWRETGRRWLGVSWQSLQRVLGWCTLGAMAGSIALAALLHLLMATVPPPVRLRFLYDALIVSLGFGHFLAAAAWLNLSQWLL